MAIEDSGIENLTDGEKLKILDIERENNIIKVDRHIQKSCLNSGTLWGLGRDDVKHQEIFEKQKETDNERAEIAKYCMQKCV